MREHRDSAPKAVLPAIAHRVSDEARRVSRLGQTLQALREALDRVSREIVLCQAILLCLWHVLSDVLKLLTR